jgi:hypothetical protein|tara:strand:- start:349 stop:765 length:417 start_codon:yes stop_codon:yes gene_type:complete
MIGTDNLAYIAGLFDGEGCVTCKKKPTKRKDRGNKIYNQWYIRCEIAMTDKYVIDFIQETLGFGWSAEKRYNNKPKYKKQWRWCCGYRDAFLFAKLMWPYAQVKLHKLEQIIDHYSDQEHKYKNVIDLATERNKRERS